MTNTDEQRFLDSHGRLTQWPSKHTDQVLMLAYLAGKFDHGMTYTEVEVNVILKKWHTFSDWPLLRRELFDRGFIDRNIDGTNYRLKELSTSVPGLVLVRPNVGRDAPFGMRWLEGKEGRKTLRLMGSTDQENKPSTLEEEKQRVRGFITATNHITWMMLYEGRVIGATWIDLEDNEYLAAPSAHIMIGNPDIRGKGVGSATFAVLIARLEEQGHEAYLYSRHLPENEAVTKLFLKVGFEDYGDIYQDSDGLSWQNVRYKLRDQRSK